MTDAMLEARTQPRHQLRANGYMPLPLFGKAPPLKEWQKLTVISHDMITLWSKVWPDAINTGALTRNTPTLDLDIMHEPAAVAVEEFIGEYFEERGPILVRIGKAPKRAILFRTDTPFRKITAPLIAPKGINDERIEFLADGQLVVVDGIHPDTRAPYRWFGGVPWDIARDQLPYLHPHEAQQLVEDIVKILIGEFRLHGDVLHADRPTRGWPAAAIDRNDDGLRGRMDAREAEENLRESRGRWASGIPDSVFGPVVAPYDAGPLPLWGKVRLISFSGPGSQPFTVIADPNADAVRTELDDLGPVAALDNVAASPF